MCGDVCMQQKNRQSTQKKIGFSRASVAEHSNYYVDWQPPKFNVTGSFHYIARDTELAQPVSRHVMDYYKK
jgi:hypothetical protein